MTTAIENEITMPTPTDALSEPVSADKTESMTSKFGNHLIAHDYVTFDRETAVLKETLDDATASKGDTFAIYYHSDQQPLTNVDDITNYVRECDECNDLADEFYMIDDGFQIYCSDECLYKNYTREEYLEKYDDGNGDSYWTNFY